MTSLLLVLALSVTHVGEADEARPALEAWSPAQAEHLLSRAGWGCSTAAAIEAAEEGPAAVVGRVLREHPRIQPFDPEVILPDIDAQHFLSLQDRRTFREGYLKRNLAQRQDYSAFWIARMLRAPQSAQERLTLFWSGIFACQHTDSYIMARQCEALRPMALGSFRDILHWSVRDAATLTFLDNVQNHYSHPNENLARELMELYSLGEGWFSEQDVREAARALTGYSVDEKGNFRFFPEDHDFGVKTLFGVTGNFDGDDLVDLILDQEQCAHYIATRLVNYFEGVEPSQERSSYYGRLLWDLDYEITPFLGRLFLDPDFYREEVMGQRFQSPLDYLVGTCVRLSIHPPDYFLSYLSMLLGLELLNPPAVDGWQEGAAWLTTANYILRANAVGVLLGRATIHALSIGSAYTSYYARNPLGRWRSRGWTADVPLADYVRHVAPADARELVEAMCADFLARPAQPETIVELVRELETLVQERSLPDVGSLADSAEGLEELLGVLHRILTCPAAHLH